jgi:hypothetical protein
MINENEQNTLSIFSTTHKVGLEGTGRVFDTTFSELDSNLIHCITILHCM